MYRKKKPILLIIYLVWIFFSLITNSLHFIYQMNIFSKLKSNENILENIMVSGVNEIVLLIVILLILFPKRHNYLLISFYEIIKLILILIEFIGSRQGRVDIWEIVFYIVLGISWICFFGFYKPIRYYFQGTQDHMRV